MTRAIEKYAPAKINLYLHVTGKRNDGYHLLDSLVVFANDIADKITATRGDTFSFSMTGAFADGLSREDLERNLAVRAARLYCDVTGMPFSFSLHLEKNIPMGAGLGGGSSDAAATIKALEELYETPLPNRDSRLLSLGADVPVCYRASSCRFEGIGDVITGTPVPPPLYMLLVWPHHHTATKDVFSLRDAEYKKPVSMPDGFGNLPNFIRFLRSTDNDLSAPAKTLSPLIREAEHLVAQTNGCLLSRMSGSGSCVFGLFETAESCTAAQKNISAIHPTWWAQTARIGV